MQELISLLAEHLDPITGAEAESDLRELQDALSSALNFVTLTICGRHSRLQGAIDQAISAENRAETALKMLMRQARP